MGIDAIITILVIIVAMVLFIAELVAVDVVALGILVTLVLTGVISPEQGVSGFANEAVLTVMGMFVLSASIIKTNIVSHIEPTITRFLKRGYWLSISGLGLVVGTMSAFVNNTPIVATFIPILNKSSTKAKLSPSRFLIPLSFIAMFGGMCTLIGTSTNLIVSGIAVERGEEAFSMFLLTPLGLIFGLAGIVYLILFGRKLIPERDTLIEDSETSRLSGFLTEIRFRNRTGLRDTSIIKVFGYENMHLDIQRIKRGLEEIQDPDPTFDLEDNDVLLVKGSIEKIKRLHKSDNFNIVTGIKEKKFPYEATKLIELILLPNSNILHKKIKRIDFYKRFSASLLAIRQRGKSKFDNLSEMVLMSGDVLLVRTSETGYQTLMELQKTSGFPFLILKETQIGRLNKGKLLIASLTIFAVVTLASLGILSISIATLSAVVLLALTKVITMEDAYKSIDWQVIFLLAGALSLEQAMYESGVSSAIGDFMIYYVGENMGPIAVVSVLYLLTTIITGVISNNAAAALFAPIAIAIAQGLEVSSIPFLVAIAFAGSSSFYTPIGYQTNTMVYSAGNYRFGDFIKVGTPLNIIFWIIATLLIPVFYPF